MVGGMKRLALAVGLLIAAPALAEEFPFRGQWEVRLPNSDYVAIMLVDEDRRVTWDAPKDQGKPAIYRGYVAERTGATMVIVLTNGAAVTRSYCEARSRDLLHCHTIRADGSRSNNYLMVKVGPGPHRLTQPGQ